VSAIYILWLRELKRYSRSRAQIIASLGQPLLYLLALGFGLGPVFQKAGQGSYLQFVAPGVIGMSVLFSSIFSGIGLLWDRQFGFLKETLVAPVPRLHIMIGRTLGGASVAMLQGTLVLVVCLIAGFRPAHVSSVPMALLFMALISIVFAALGTAIGSTLQNMQGFQLIMNFLVMPIFFLSGALFPLTNLPKALAVVTSIDPLTYGIDGLRGAFNGVSHFGAGVDMAVLGVVAMIFMALGAYSFSKIQICMSAPHRQLLEGRGPCPGRPGAAIGCRAPASACGLAGSLWALRLRPELRRGDGGQQ
jgi:ABC-2 type transport system permease protein